VLDDSDFSQYQNPMYIRVTKAGSAYVAFYSVNGANWTQGCHLHRHHDFYFDWPFASTTVAPLSTLLPSSCQ
jgi:hypothetical protein